jgi:hypothetical protein
MPSNQLPEDVREQFDSLLKRVGMGGLGRLAAKDALDAVAPLIIEWALGEAVDWARSCSGESADAAADYIEDMRARGVKATGATASAFNMQDVARMAGLPAPETTGGE